MPLGEQSAHRGQSDRRRARAVTTARLWTECHFSTRGVEGDAGHPARTGGHITGKVRIAGIEGTGTRVVVEHDGLCHLSVETDLAAGRLRISYQLDTVAGAARVSGVT